MPGFWLPLLPPYRVTFLKVTSYQVILPKNIRDFPSAFKWTSNSLPGLYFLEDLPFLTHLSSATSLFHNNPSTRTFIGFLQEVQLVPALEFYPCCSVWLCITCNLDFCRNGFSFRGWWPGPPQSKPPSSHTHTQSYGHSLSIGVPHLSSQHLHLSQIVVAFSSPLEQKLQETMDFTLYLGCLGLCLAWVLHSVNTCWMNGGYL